MTTCLRDAAELFVDGDWVESKDQDPQGQVRLIQLADIGIGVFLNRSSRYLTSSKAKDLRCTYLNPGDVLIARMPDPIGRACVFPDLGRPCVTAVDVAILRPKREVSAEYLVNWINQPEFRARVAHEAKGATRKRISRRNLEGLPVRIPCGDEQRRIVTRIKECMGRVEEIEVLRAGSDKETAQLLRSFYRDLYRSLAARYTCVPLKSVGKVVGGGTPSKQNPSFWTGSIPWVSPKDMKCRDLESATDKISQAALDGSAAKLIEKPSVLFVVRGMILAHTLPVAISRVPLAINQDMKAITPQSDFEVDFVAAMLRGAEADLLRSVEVAGHGTRRLQTEHWERLPIPFVPKNEQLDLVSKVGEVERSIDMMRDSCPAQDVGKLREVILRKAFSGGL